MRRTLSARLLLGPRANAARRQSGSFRMKVSMSRPKLSKPCHSHLHEADRLWLGTAKTQHEAIACGRRCGQIRTRHLLRLRRICPHLSPQQPSQGCPWWMTACSIPRMRTDRYRRFLAARSRNVAIRCGQTDELEGGSAAEHQSRLPVAWLLCRHLTAVTAEFWILTAVNLRCKSCLPYSQVTRIGLS